MEETPEVYSILMKYSLLNKFGWGNTWASIDNESYLDMIYIQVCMSAEQKAQEFAERKADFYSKEALR